jgi:hypothetical protein
MVEIKAVDRSCAARQMIAITLVEDCQQRQSATLRTVFMIT